MGESAHEWTKKRKVFATKNTNIVCEHCGRKWTATLAEVPVTYFIKDLDEYYENLSNNVLETVNPPLVLYVFRPTDRHFLDTEITLSCVAPQQESPYHWCINHKYSGSAAASGCQLIPWREQNIVTIEDEIKKEGNEEMIEEIIVDPLTDDEDVKPDAKQPCTSSNGRVIPLFKASFGYMEQNSGDSVHGGHTAGSDNSMRKNRHPEQDMVTIKDKNKDEGEEDMIEEILIPELDVNSITDPARSLSSSSNGSAIPLCTASGGAGRVLGCKELRSGKVVHVGHTARPGNVNEPGQSAYPPNSSKQQNSQLSKMCLRERLIHLLAVRRYSKNEIYCRICSEGCENKNKKSIIPCLRSVSIKIKRMHQLKSSFWGEVKEDWPFYTDEEKTIAMQHKAQHFSPHTEGNKG